MGTTVGACPWAVHHDPDVFGPAAHEFRPDRWVWDEEENSSYSEQMVHCGLSFGSGSHKCPGMYVAHVAVEKVLVQVSTHALDLAISRPKAKD